MAPIAVVESNVISLLEQINTFPSIWYAIIDLTTAIFFIPVDKDHHE